MEVITGALPSVITKLTVLATGEYNLQKGLKGEIKFLQEELVAMKVALEDVSKVPVDQLPNGDKIWARNVRELSYDIEDSIDKFLVQFEGRKLGNQHGLKKVIDRSLDWLVQPKIRHKIATEIKEIKSHVLEVHERHRRYEVNYGINKPVTANVDHVDPRLFAQYTKMTELVGIDKERDELIKTMMEGNEMPLQKGKIVSIVGFGGLGKTTLANAVYQKLRVQFDCWSFVSVSQTPDLKKIFKGLLDDLGKNINDEALDEGRLIKELRESLQEKRYFIVIDDIWDIKVWKMIKCALPDNDVGSMIVTTTRNRDVAEQVGGAYQMKPLSLSNSQKLLYERIFGNENKYSNEDTEKCPDEELAEVSNRILKKCAGVPLAIITIASLLTSKGRNKMDWYEVCNSIGTGLHNNYDVGNMRKILLLSYYDLPSHLKTCLLYLSVFPEDFKIERDRLIWMWVAEGFIQCTRQGESLTELGESYFNELINRSMIQFVVNHEYRRDIEYCCVHDMVLEIIRIIASKENFITVVHDDKNHTSPTNTVRRLSLQNCEVDHARIGDKTNNKIRSVIVFLPGNYPKLNLGTFEVLRVLDLESCDLSNVHVLEHVGKLTHLRYLGLRNTFIGQLPNEEIRKLRFLQTLDIRDTMITVDNFPLAVFQLKHLRCLHIPSHSGVPKGISNLTSLEVLSLIWIRDTTTIIELGHLTELRVLKIMLDTSRDDELEESLVECLHKLKKIQSVDISGTIRLDEICQLDTWRAPPQLRRIDLDRCCMFSVRPDWMTPSHLVHLTFLSVIVLRLQQEDIAIIGRLPALRDLDLSVDSGLSIVVDGSLFPNLVRCKLLNFMPPVVFRQGAMPRLTHLEFTFAVRKTREIAGSNVGSLDIGLEKLTALQNILVCFTDKSDRKDDREEAMSVLSHAVEIHPNRPRLESQNW